MTTLVCEEVFVTFLVSLIPEGKEAVTQGHREFIERVWSHASPLGSTDKLAIISINIKARSFNKNKVPTS